VTFSQYWPVDIWNRDCSKAFLVTVHACFILLRPQLIRLVRGLYSFILSTMSIRSIHEFCKIRRVKMAKTGQKLIYQIQNGSPSVGFVSWVLVMGCYIGGPVNPRGCSESFHFPEGVL